jgi:hypothetical protein
MSESDRYGSEGRSALNSVFSRNPSALIGATNREGSVGRTVLDLLHIPAFHCREIRRPGEICLGLKS